MKKEVKQRAYRYIVKSFPEFGETVKYEYFDSMIEEKNTTKVKFLNHFFQHTFNLNIGFGLGLSTRNDIHSISPRFLLPEALIRPEHSSLLWTSNIYNNLSAPYFSIIDKNHCMDLNNTLSHVSVTFACLTFKTILLPGETMTDFIQSARAHTIIDDFLAEQSQAIEDFSAIKRNMQQSVMQFAQTEGKEFESYLQYQKLKCLNTSDRDTRRHKI